MKIAIIPARGGSKRIPQKNIRDFCGRPMIAWSIKAAQESGVFDRIIVSTDSEEIAVVARKCGAQTPFRRPAELADDFAATAPVLEHALRWLEAESGLPEIFCCIYPTAPFLGPEHLRRGLELLLSENAACAFSVASFDYPVWRGLRINTDNRLEMLWPENENCRSQDLPEAIHDAGQFYWARSASFLATGRLFADAVPVRLPRHLAQDIDTEEDWIRSELMFKALHGPQPGLGGTASGPEAAGASEKLQAGSWAKASAAKQGAGSGAPVQQKLLITGVSGLLGSNLALLLRKDFDVAGTYHAHPVRIPGVRCLPCDLADYAATRELFRRETPDIVLHCASRTDMDAMESDPEGAWTANVLTTRNVLDALRDSLAKLVYISTDAVYPGCGGPCAEDSPTEPRNVYGATKLRGEALALARPGTLVLRTNLYGWNIREKLSLGEWFLGNLLAGRPCKGFSDARFSGIYTMPLGGVIRDCLQAGLSGLYNCASNDSMTKYEFGQELARSLGADPGLITPVPLAEAGLAAERGRDLALDVRRLEAALGKPLPGMSDSIRAFVADRDAGVQAQLRQSMGGLPDRHFHPHREELGYGGQCIDEQDIAAVVGVLRSPLLTQGDHVPAFERAVAERCHAAHGLAVSSGTAALHLACLALGLGPGDEVVTSPITFVASANCARYCGATPTFCDIDPRTGNMDPAALERAITPRTRAVIPVHFAGQSCDMAAIRQVVDRASARNGAPIHVIEDASHALGSQYRDAPVGGCAWSDMTVFSFHPVKHITTGEGGLVTTNDAGLAEELALLRSHGITRDPARLSRHPGPWYYEQVALGFNYRITDLQCALGLSQLAKLDWFAQRRRRFVERYNTRISGLPHVRNLLELPECRSNFHLYVALIDFAALGMDRPGLLERLTAAGIHAQVHYIPVHQQPDFVRLLGPQSLPRAEAFYDRCLSLPLLPSMCDADVDRVVECLAP